MTPCKSGYEVQNDQLQGQSTRCKMTHCKVKVRSTKWPITRSKYEVQNDPARSKYEVRNDPVQGQSSKLGFLA